MPNKGNYAIHSVLHDHDDLEEDLLDEDDDAFAYGRPSDLEGHFPVPSFSSEHHLPLFLANTMQLADFRLSDDVINTPTPKAPTCDRKEIIASSNWKYQLFSLSTAICLIQIILLVVMVQLDGFAPMKENPFWGPPVGTLVHFGAKEAADIIYRNEWWRLLSSIMLHGGVIHIVPNVVIQVSTPSLCPCVPVLCPAPCASVSLCDRLPDLLVAADRRVPHIDLWCKAMDLDLLHLRHVRTDPQVHHFPYSPL